MSNLQIVEALCGLIEQQTQLLRKLTFALEEANAFDAESSKQIGRMESEYANILDTDAESSAD